MKLVAWAQEVKKALTAAASVVAAIQASSGTPTDVKAWLADALAALGTFGIVWVAENKPSV